VDPFFADIMAGKNEPALGETYQSDQGETEDEEVKRNCIMGESGMRDSDFSDSDFENDEKEEASNGESEEDQTANLVKFVSVGSQILKSKVVVVYRPTPIVPRLALFTATTNKNDEDSNEFNLKRKQSTSSRNTVSECSPILKADNEKEISISTSSINSSDGDSDCNNGDSDTVTSESGMKSTCLDFAFGGGEDLSMEVDEIANIAPDTEDRCCKSSLDYQHEARELMIGEYALVGASGASVDDKWLMAKEKRVLSSNTLSALNQETGRNADFRKKMRLSHQQSCKYVSAIPEITVGIEALDQIIQPLPRQYLVRDDSQLIPSSSDSEGDKMLSEELDEKFRKNDVACSGSNLPIPLLTPPQSPRTVDGTVESQTITSVEWPSNLVMDSAIIKTFANISPIKEIGQLKKNSSNILVLSESSERSLAPRLRTISVGTP